MIADSLWMTRLKAAAQQLEHTPDAPEWLRLALRDAITVAPGLAPIQKPAITPQSFFYPH